MNDEWRELLQEVPRTKVLLGRSQWKPNPRHSMKKWSNIMAWRLKVAPTVLVGSGGGGRVCDTWLHCGPSTFLTLIPRSSTVPFCSFLILPMTFSDSLITYPLLLHWTPEGTSLCPVLQNKESHCCTKIFSTTLLWTMPPISLWVFSYGAVHFVRHCFVWNARKRWRKFPS